MRQRWISLAGVLLALTVAGPVHAQTEAAGDEAPKSDEEARGLFLAGRAAYEEGRYADALRHFERSYELSGRPGLLYNIGQTADRLRHDERAIEAFEAFLERFPEAENREEVEQRLAAMRSNLARRDAREEGGATDSPADDAEPVTMAAMPSPAAAPTPEDAVDEPVSKKWWLWTAVGVVVVGVAVGVGVSMAGGSAEPEPVAPGSGVVISTWGLP